MGDYTLENVLDEVLRRDFMLPDEHCKHKFSLRHRRGMKKLFSANTDVGFEKTTVRIPVKKRLLVALVLVLLMALAGISAAANFGGSFIGTFGFMKNAAGTTGVVSLDIQNENSFISEIYRLDVLPAGYVYNEYCGGLDRAFTFYRNGTGDLIMMMQSVKKEFSREYYATVSEFTETNVNGMSGYYSTVEEYTDLVWDNGEYVFELNGKLPAQDLIEAAESLCIDTDYRMGLFRAENL